MEEKWPLRVDLHTNLGFVPDTKKQNSQSLHITPERLANFLNKFKITHNIVLYSNYEELEELDRLTPNTKLYGLKWVNDIHDLTKHPEKLDIGKPLWAGLKFHSHRCFSIDKETGEKVYGLDYSDVRLIGKILEHLPDNSIINMHTQGSASLKNMACPRAIYNIAMKYPNLKFIISHMGAYGKGAYDPVYKYFPNVRLSEQSQDQKKYQQMRQVFHVSEMLVRDAVYLVERLPNLFLNTAILYPLKRQPLNDTDRWGLGSDYPFTHTTPTNWDEHSYDVQVNLANNYVGEEKQLRSHHIALEWIEKDICTPPKKKWFAFFSRSGSEILQLSKELNRMPDVIITNKQIHSLKNTKLYDQLCGSTQFVILPKDFRASDYVRVFEKYDLISGYDIITLHGFLKIIPARIVNKYDMVNLHPGLITKYPYLKGLDPQKRTWEKLDLFSEIGCVLHKVTKEVDEGEVISSISTNIGDESQWDEGDVYDTLGELAIKLWSEYLTKNLIE
jgi:folate-dependent phosphoribosylglycinamide formyltransferase PurN